jgi:hypothetical protein
MRKASTLDQDIDRILRGVGIQKTATTVNPPVEASESTTLRKLASILRTYTPPPLSYEDFHAVKNGSFDPGPVPVPQTKIASTGVSADLRRLAYGLRIADHLHRMKTAQQARNILQAAEGLILLRQRQGLT